MSDSTTNHPLSKPERKFPVMEVFGPTIQGEGSMCGRQTMFVRFGGCDYRCTKCDSLHAVIPELVSKGATRMDSTEIVQKLTELRGNGGCNWVTLSGGNPAMHDLTKLISLLHAQGWYVAVETQGTLWQDWMLACDIVTVSPKGPGMGEKTDWYTFEDFLDRLSSKHPASICIKVVIFDHDDLAFAKEVKAYIGKYNLQLYLSLGNGYPPQPGNENAIAKENLIAVLLRQYAHIADMLYKDKELASAIFLPQLHVLVYGNARGK